MSISMRAARLPRPTTLRFSAVTLGSLISHMNESSHEMIDRSSGTLNPSLRAVLIAASAMTSLSHTMAVGGFGRDSSRSTLRRPAAGE